ncbi:MAG: antitoxin family protein [Bryobacter sp.]|nr:antitoxin family protein [Bryobacter sp.]
MPRQIEAIFEHGVLRPLEPLSLEENQRVAITVVARSPSASPQPHTSTLPLAGKNREAELRWLAEASTPYAGQWVALDGSLLLAHGEHLADVRSAALAADVPNPFFARVPHQPSTPFAGW